MSPRFSIPFIDFLSQKNQTFPSKNIFVSDTTKLQNVQINEEEKKFKQEREEIQERSEMLWEQESRKRSKKN